jgi:hypothetical protein
MLGAGKTSLAFPLAAELGYSLVTKDLVKETLHDCPAEVAVARYNARSRHEVHVLKEVTLTEMERYDRPVGIGSLITVDTTAPVDVAAVAA